MKKKNKEKLIKWIFFLFVIFLGAITSYFMDFNKENSLMDTNNLEEVGKNNDLNEIVEPKLQVHYIDVGQADAILITQGEVAMLIDAGKNDTEDYLENYLKEHNITNLEYVIGTHAHEDHIGGIDKVINDFEVNNIFFPKTAANTKTFENFVNSVKSRNKKIYAPQVGENFKLGDAEFEIIAPNASKYDRANDYSICLKLKYKNKSFLFMGDAEKTSEEEIINNNIDLKSDVLKLGHHGSKTSTTSDFLEKVSPEYVVISCGKDNDYSHPSKEIMIKLQASKIPVFRTDESGTIVLSTDRR